MHDETSIVRQLHRDRNFEPPFCPRASCVNHYPERAQPNFFRLHGLNKLKRFPYQAFRFRCVSCGKTFQPSFFQLDYCQKVWGKNYEIDRLDNLGASKRAIGREIGHSERMVRDRLLKMSRWGLLLHAKMSGHLKVSEPIVYDGLENFAYSQFDPNNINHAVGKKTLFTYDFNYCPINRKGRMSEAQALKKRAIEKKFGPYPADAIRTATRRIFERLVERSQEALVLYTDRHFMYARVVEVDLREHKIEHVKISSKVHRNYQNPLFAVNNIDLQARQCASPFKRETISYSKHSIAMQESFLRYVLRRNYRRPKFWGTHRSDPECSTRSPAMELGITSKILSFDDFYQTRIMPTHVRLNEDWKNLYCRVDPLSRQKIAA